MQKPHNLPCPICCRDVAMISAAQAAHLVGVTRHTIYRWASKRMIHVRATPSGRLRICRDSVAAPNALQARDSGASGPVDARIQIALSLIQRQYQDENLALSGLSHQLNMSAGYLGRCFKKEVGVTFRQYLRAVRMEKAEMLLRDSLLSIKQLAAAVGYKHVSDFDNHFKLRFGVKPSDYRRIVMRSGFSEGLR